MRLFVWILLAWFGWPLLFWTGLARGETPSPALTKESLKEEFGDKENSHRKEPVDIGSKQMSVDMESHTIVFRGDVRVRQGELQLQAQEVTAVFGSDIHDIVEIVARGDVSVQKAGRLAYGEEAVYDRRKATIALTGKPYLKEGDNSISGEKILVWLDEERMEIQGDVKAVLKPGNRPDASGQESWKDRLPDGPAMGAP
ncbi:MAG: LptA/OstA family protein [bacterium]